MRRRLAVKKPVLTALLFLAILGAIIMLGPRTSSDMTVTFDPGVIGADIDSWLAESEADHADIRPGLAKEIVWADPANRTRTPIAIVYIHGFSASKGEIRPLPDLVAHALGANLFYTRLAGHGRSNDAMAQASTADWANDMAEALAIGDRLGERTIVIATSTGATLTTWALADRSLSSRVAAVVFLSANFRIKARGSSLLTAPWARSIAHLVLGARRGFTPLNALHASLWTPEYPVDALLPMAALVKLAGRLDVSAVATPALFIQSLDDQVVDTVRSSEIAALWGGPVEIIDPGPVDDPFQHVLAGDALSPSTTEPLSAKIISWLRKTVQASV